MAKKVFIFIFAAFGAIAILNSCNSDDSDPNGKNPDPDDSELPTPEPENPEPPKEGTFNYKTFHKVHTAFGDGLSQNVEDSFDFPTDIEKVKSIKMYVQFDCPCNIWDVFANIQAKDKISGEWYEIGRYITPYGKDSSPLERGLEFDVTDFKSILTGTTELKAYTEVWGADGWLISVDFDFIYGESDYKYSSVIPILQYNANSIDGEPYGEPHNFVMNKMINLPENSEAAHLRTIISGWGHATPNDPGGRGCAEWCFRTHHILINNVSSFNHYLGSIGCADNPIIDQRGNWKPDRAGWCPGMAVPTRIDKLDKNLLGKQFKFEYQFQEWENNMEYPGDNPHAYYALSTFVIVKSNTPIEKPTVVN
ncbi:peptide-N-glycosidase F-related protein [Myroides indicus]|uniref:Peptide-N-glycosidase F-like protein n=1 Tax=Myroides indicus TaxID=1323422 RepID=A0A4R7EMC3_9FLAO|nr:peptide-N-glycosidase F-related protein [Myroides indicus]TDS51842.1 peptide-N-glycosidase F-like protein [Myroides indicus]